MPPKKGKSAKVAPAVSIEPPQLDVAGEADHLVVEVLPGARKDLDGQLLPVPRKLAASGAQIGRTKASPVWIKESTVSERHARFAWAAEDKHWTIEDLGSSNGTEINSKSIQEGERHPLKHGDIIKLGSVDVRVHTHCPIPADTSVRRLVEEAAELEIQHRREQAKQLQSRMREHGDGADQRQQN